MKKEEKDEEQEEEEEEEGGSLKQQSGVRGQNPDQDLVYLAIGGGLRVNVHGGQVVRFLGPGAAVDAGQVDQLLSRTCRPEPQEQAGSGHLDQ